MGLFLKKYHLLRCWDCLPLYWIEALTSSLSLTPLPKKGSLDAMRFLSSEVALYLYKSSIQFNMEYCCLAWVIVPSCNLVMLNKQQKPVCWTTLFAALEPVALRQNVASLNFFPIGITLVDVHLKWLN